MAAKKSKTAKQQIEEWQKGVRKKDKAGVEVTAFKVKINYKSSVTLVKNPPKGKVSGLKLARSGSKLTASWKYPSDAFSAKNNARWNGYRYSWVAKEGDFARDSDYALGLLKLKGDVKYLFTTATTKTGTRKKLTDRMVSGNGTSMSVTIERKQYYPFSRKPTDYEKMEGISTYHYVYRRVDGYPNIAAADDDKGKQARAAEKKVLGTIPPLFTIRILSKADYELLGGWGFFNGKFPNPDKKSSRTTLNQNSTNRRYVEAYTLSDEVPYPCLSAVEIAVTGWNKQTSYYVTDAEWKKAYDAAKKVKDQATADKPKTATVTVNYSIKTAKTATWNDFGDPLTTASATFTFAKPAAPTVDSSVTFDNQTYRTTFKITAKNDNTGTKERYDTRYVTSVDAFLVDRFHINNMVDESGKASGKRYHWVVKSLTGATTGTSKSIVFNPSNTSHMNNLMGYLWVKDNDTYEAIDKNADGIRDWYSSASPKEEGWYEYKQSANPQYSPSSDNSVQSGKTYYLREKATIERTASGLFRGEFIKVAVYAYNRGYAGNSAMSAVRTFIYAHPDYQLIHKLTKTGDNYIVVLGHTWNKQAEVGKDEQGNNVLLKAESGVDSAMSKWTYYYNTKTVTLQVMKDLRPSGSDNWTENDWNKYLSRQAVGSWTNIVTVDYTQREIQVAARDIEPTQVYQRTYLRVVSSNGIYPDQYSIPFLVPVYDNVPSAANEKITILAAESIEKGTVMKVALAWKRGESPDATGEETVAPPDSDGTQLSWSENVYGWYSSNTPATFDLPDEEYLCKSEEINCRDNSTVLNITNFGLSAADLPEGTCAYITGLTPGKKYYIRARRYLDGGREDRSYGKYATYNLRMGSDGKFVDGGVENPVTMYIDVLKVKLNVPTNVPKGQNVSAGWGYQNDEAQKKWQLNYGAPVEETVTENNVQVKKVKVLTDDKKSLRNPVTLASGEDEITNHLIRYVDEAIEKKLLDNKLYLQVKVSLDGESWGESNVEEILYVDPPKAGITSADTITSLPYTVKAWTDSPNARLNLTIRAYEVNARWGPTGDEEQAEGEVLYTKSIPKESLTQAIAKDGSVAYQGEFSIPPDVLFFDRGKYEVEVFASDDDTGLDSRKEVEYRDENDQLRVRLSGETQILSVAWAHVAHAPSSKSYVQGSAEGGYSAVIYPVRPDKVKDNINVPDAYVSTDVCDVYRVTPDGAKLIASGVRFNDDPMRRGTGVVDRFAPFSSYDRLKAHQVISYAMSEGDLGLVGAYLRYRLVTRTKEGDLAWIDVGYSLRYYGIQFDWNPKSMANDRVDEGTKFRGTPTSLSLPFNVSYSDAFTKDFEARKHMSGEYDGYWSEGVHRTSSLSTEVVKIAGAEEMEKARNLARYDGPVFVRTPSGCAFCANVNVSEISYDYDSMTATLKFDAEEIALTEDFMGNIVTIPGLSG